MAPNTEIEDKHIEDNEMDDEDIGGSEIGDEEMGDEETEDSGSQTNATTEEYQTIGARTNNINRTTDLQIRKYTKGHGI